MHPRAGFEKKEPDGLHKLPDFDSEWRRRFRDFGAAYDDDAAIAGWTPGGLATRLRHFERVFPVETRGRWLDAGCGAGTYTRRIEQRGASVVGVDYSAPSVTKARARDPGAKLYVIGDVTRLPFADNSFDGAVCYGVTQALASSAGAVLALGRVIRPSGHLWIDALNANCLPNAIGELLRRITRRPHRLRYERHADLVALLKEHGFGSIRVLWLPIMPGPLRRLQWIFDSRLVTHLFRRLPLLGAMFSHSFVVRAVKGASERGAPKAASAQ